MVKPVRKAVFPVGGLGTRFLPATKAMPKEMLPVVDKPLIEYAVDEAKAAGIEEFIFVTGRGKAAIEDHFDLSLELETQMLDKGKNREALISHSAFKPGQVAFTRQQQALGLGHAVWCARNLVGNEPFAVLLADDLVKSQVPCLAQILHHYQKVGGNIIAVEAISPEHTNRYGIIEPGIWDHNLVDVKGIIEKPSPATAPSNIAVIGRYVLQPEVFDFLDSQTVGAGGEIQLTDSLSSMVGRLPFHGLQFEGQRFDCGDKVGFQEANIAFSLDRPDISEQMRELIGKYSSDKNA